MKNDVLTLQLAAAPFHDKAYQAGGNNEPG